LFSDVDILIVPGRVIQHTFGISNHFNKLVSSLRLLTQYFIHFLIAKAIVPTAFCCMCRVVIIHGTAAASQMSEQCLKPIFHKANLFARSESVLIVCCMILFVGDEIFDKQAGSGCCRSLQVMFSPAFV
jgi:hypothetical protein